VADAAGLLWRGEAPLPDRGVPAAPIRFRSLVTEVDGLPIHVRAGEPPTTTADRPPVVMVHGLGLSGRYMMPTAALLALRFAVRVPDLPGFGDSGKPRRVLDVPGLAAGLAAWMDAAEVGPAVLVGNSHGCQIIGELAARRPDLVARAVLQGPTAPPGERTWLQQFVRWRQNAPYNPPELTPLSYEDYRKAGYLRTLLTFRYSLQDRLEDKLGRITAPTLVVRGQHDPICREGWAERVAAGLPDGRLVIVPGVAHTLCYTSPVELASVCRAFIEEGSTAVGRGAA
jgi:2-hydroxy-6-oxonona-2,4-dienedioate hydrolase